MKMDDMEDIATPSYMASNDLIDIRGTSINKLLDEYRKELKLDKYPNTCVITNVYPIKMIGKKYESKLIDKTIYKIREEETGSYTLSFKYITENHVMIADYFPFAIEKNIMFIFYKDYKTLLEEFKEEDLPYYKVGQYYLTQTSFGYVLDPLSLSVEESPILNSDISSFIKKDMTLFFQKREFFAKNKLSFKRGIMLYGPPGNGKTSLIRTILKELPNTYGIIIDCSRGFSIDISSFLKMALDDKPKVLVFEDIDGIEPYHRSSLLNFLDGIDTLENTIVIATTNDITKVDRALVNRPSRFDRAYFIGEPDENSRMQLLTKFFPTLTKEELEICVRETEGFSGAYFKELFVFKNLHDCPVSVAVKNMKEQLKLFCDFGKDDTDYVG